MDCILCSNRGFQKDRLDEGKKLAARRDQSLRAGLNCSVCQRFACRQCMVAFVKKAGTSARHDPWCNTVNVYLSTNTVPSYFLGSCCELKMQQTKRRGVPTNDTADVEEEFTNKIEVKPTNQIQEKTAKGRIKHGQGSRAKRAKRLKIKQKQEQHTSERKVKPEMKRQRDNRTMEEKKRYDGSIHFSEFDLLVDAPLDCVDIHGLGECGKQVGVIDDKIQWKIEFNPVAHCVVSQEAADSYEQSNTRAAGTAADYSTEIRKISIQAVHDPSQIYHVRTNDCGTCLLLAGFSLFHFLMQN